MTKPITFMFEFSSEDSDACSHAFNVSEEAAAKISEDPRIVEEIIYTEMTRPIEEKYGVHDGAGWTDEDDTIIGIGFVSSEIQEEEIPLLMESWRQAFIERSGGDENLVSKSFPVTDVQTGEHSNEIYAVRDYITEQSSKKLPKLSWSIVSADTVGRYQ